MDRSTIAAIATPAGSGGIGIIRISGPDAVPAAAGIFRPGAPRKNSPSPEEPASPLASWRLHYGHIVDPMTGCKFDEVILAVMRAPHSYTREDVVEIQAHAGPAVLRAILDLLISRGARLAEPGEFTRRAFLNGRIDLTQAEAVIDLINARSDAALEMATTQLAGGLASEINRMRAEIADLLSEMEAIIDFSEAINDEIDTARLYTRLSDSVCEPISELIARHDAEDVLRTGYRVVIVGGPNVGKSSLMNRLIGTERAIVSDLPGTTRDFIEASMLARGVPIVLADTAGMRISTDPVEKLGIEKAKEYIDSADIVLFVIDAGIPLRNEDLALFDDIASKRIILVINKSDLPADKRFFTPPSQWEAVSRVETSALYDIGIDSLKLAIAALAGDFSARNADRLVPNLRHRVLLDRARHSITCALNGLENGISPEFISIDLRSAHDALSEITGERIAPDLLDRIFERYCIGK